jgi:outer membrane receptor protein involved in Fe transport
MVLLVSTTRADDVLQEVVVTAEKRVENLQDTTIAISALTQDDIEGRGMEGWRDWAAYVPGIIEDQGTDPSRRSGPEPTIRGVSQVVRGQIWEVPAFGTATETMGQTPFSNGDPSMFDLARVEVLRGPQGTLQGLASMGGTIRFIPNDAQTNKFSSTVYADAGTMSDQGGDTTRGGVVVNLPLIQDVLAVRLAGEYDYNGGWINLVKPSLGDTGVIKINPHDFTQSLNPSNTINNANTSSKTGGRVSVTYTPTADLSIKAFTNFQKTSYATTDIVDLNAISTKPELIGFSLQPLTEQFSVSSLEASYDLGFGTLNYAGGYYKGNNSETTDNTLQVPGLLAGKIPNVLQANPALPADPYPGATSFPFVTESQTIDNELRLQGQKKPLGLAGMTFDYIVGVYHETEAREGDFVVSAPNWNADKGPNTLPILTAGGDILSSIGAGFYRDQAEYGSLTLNLTDKLSIGGGVRYSAIKFHSSECRYGDFYSGKASNGATVGDSLIGCPYRVNVGQIAQDETTPSASISYKITDDKMVYFTASQGKRLPEGFQNPTALAPLPAECTTLAKNLGLYNFLLTGTKSDSIWSYDLGLKSKWLDNKLLLNADLYYLIWSNLQEAVSILEYNPACSAQIPANLGQAISKGVEIQAAYATGPWHLEATLATTDAYFSEVPPGVSSSLPGVYLKAGDRLRMTPPITASAGAEFDFRLPEILGTDDYSGFWRVDWRYVDGMMDNFGDVHQLEENLARSYFFTEASSNTDIRAGVKRPNLLVFLYMSNVFNHEQQYESDQNAFQLNFHEASISQPRTVGVSIRKSF